MSEKVTVYTLTWGHRQYMIERFVFQITPYNKIHFLTLIVMINYILHVSCIYLHQVFI